MRDDGSTEWKYESREDGLNSTSMDVAIFWVGLIVPAFIWFLLGIGSVFRLSFDWLLLIAIALALSGEKARARQPLHMHPALVVTPCVRTQTGLHPRLTFCLARPLPAAPLHTSLHTPCAHPLWLPGNARPCY